MAKRKREVPAQKPRKAIKASPPPKPSKPSKLSKQPKQVKQPRELKQANQPIQPKQVQLKKPKQPDRPPQDEVTIQIISGSYEGIIYGITATVSKSAAANSSPDATQFTIAFLYKYEGSPIIRTLALGPLPNPAAGDRPVVLLAGGANNGHIDISTLSPFPPPSDEHLPPIPVLGGMKVRENPGNRRLDPLKNHSTAITSLYFPSKSKLISAAENDKEISIVRTRDWSRVGKIKTSTRNVQGRPSGDTAPLGAAPWGLNDFAIHPSMTLMLGVAKGEKCMRLFNLLAGKQEGVLNFDRKLLEAVKEGKWSSGEGRKIEWDSEGSEFAVAFERGVVVYTLTLATICTILPSPLTKLHQMKYVNVGTPGNKLELLALSTEDGRILFYSTHPCTLIEPADGPAPNGQLVAQLGGKDHGQPIRIKDFEFLPITAPGWDSTFLIVTADTDGAVKLWMLTGSEFPGLEKLAKKEKSNNKAENGASPITAVPQVGKLLGTYETDTRITCMRAFAMLDPEDEPDYSDDDEEVEEEVVEEGDSDSDSE
ncbi:hypothetical protein FQN50_001470 [Emmonsiellopsis sp. PD_5]|nr:hypothetical protein FQN50_001470 [Emmonsiellopsis sp. PD_5]